MAIQFPNFERISFDEANPFLTGMKKGQDIFSTILAQQLAQLQNQRLENELPFVTPMAEQALTKAKQENQFNPRIWESEIGLRGAQAGKLGKETQWYDREANASIAQKMAEAQKAKMLQDMIGNILKGQAASASQPNNISSTSSPAQSAPTTSGIAPTSQPTLSPYNAPSNGAIAPNAPTGITYPQAAVMSSMLGLGKPQILDVNGTQLAVTPWGNIPVAQGLTALQKNLAKKDAEHISLLESNVINGTKKQETLNELSSIVSSPAFENMRQHPVAGSFELKAYSKFGTPEEQQLIGQYMTTTGEIIKDTSSEFKGQFRVGEQALLNTMKPNLSDSLDTAKGKIESLSLMNQLLLNRSRIAADLMRNQGMSPIRALEEADKQIDGIKIRENIRQSLKSKSSSNQGKVLIRNKNTGAQKYVTPEEAKKMGVSF